MKTNNSSRIIAMMALVATFVAAMWSCSNDDDPSLEDLRNDKLSYLEDSLRISDSLNRVNAAGVVNYAITVVSGSTSSLFKNSGDIDVDFGRIEATKSVVEGAIVTISQFGKVLKDTTDASGMVVFNGFFRTSVNVTIEKEGFTTVSYISVVNKANATENSGIYFVGNLIPIFETTGNNTATISGRATIQTNLTNRVKELVPDGTTVTASIDASSPEFSNRFLTTALDYSGYLDDDDTDAIYVGNILDAAYSTNIVGTVTGGNYTLTVPAAVNGLPLSLDYSDIAADQTLYVNNWWPALQTPADRMGTYRNLFSPGFGLGELSFIPPGSGVEISFVSYTTEAVATAVTSPTAGTLDRINVKTTGDGYSGTPLIEITGGGGTGATATATVVNGALTSITLTNPGSGYTGVPTVTIVSGTGATGGVTVLGQDGTVTSVVITNSGAGYTTAPTVTFSAPTGTGLVAPVTATGTATISNGRVTGVTITNAGAAYIANPTITFSAPPAGGTQATANAFYSGQSIANVTVTNQGAGYSYAPAVTFDLPNIPTGVRATGTALINPTTRQVTGITITNPGSGYTTTPGVTLSAVTTPATTEVFLTGGSVTSATIGTQGDGYAYPPKVVFTGGGGQGAAATAVLSNGKVIGLNITNGGTGYTGAPSIEFVTGDGATAYATVTNGAISQITVADGGRNFNGAPRVIIEDTGDVGGGATATATVVNGQITGVTVTNGGTGYLEGNIPNTREAFISTKGFRFEVKPGLKYINDIHYGTGKRTTP